MGGGGYTLAKGKELVLALNNSEASLSSDRVFRFSNDTSRSFINGVKYLKISACLKPVDGNYIEGACFLHELNGGTGENLLFMLRVMSNSDY